MFRTALVRVQAPARARFFSTTPVAAKSVVDTAKDALKKVDRTVADGAVKGIEVGEKAAETIKQTIPNNTTQAKHQAQGAAQSAKSTAQSAADSLPENAQQAKGQAQELAGEAKGKASELAGEAKGTKEEYKGKAQGKAAEVRGKTGV